MKRWIAILPLMLLFVAASVYVPHRRQHFRPSGFSPSDVPNMIAWYKADALTGASVGDPITNWFDSGPNGFTLVQPNSSKRPYFTNNVAKYGGLPWIQFSGLEDVIQAYTNIYAQPNTIFVVCHSDIISGTMRILVGTNSSHYCSFSTVAILQAYAGSAIQGSANSIVNAQSYLMEYTYNGVSSSIRTNDTLYVSGNAGALSIAGLVVGSDPNEGNRWLRGGIAEIIIYNSDVYGPDRTLLRNYFISKYGPYASW